MDKLLSNAYEGCKTLGDIWDRSVKKYGNEPCMGSRQLLEGEEIQKDGTSLIQLTYGKYIFETYEEVDNHVSSIIEWFKLNELKRGDHVVIFAETRSEWMKSALACFKYGLPGILNAITV
jgi:long-chain acyl-CoA synthetase